MGVSFLVNMKLVFLLSVISAQFDYSSLYDDGQNTLNPESYGFSTEEVFGPSDGPTNRLLTAYQESVGSMTSPLARGRERIGYVIPGEVRFVDYVEGGNFDGDGFRQALNSAIQKELRTITTTSLTTRTTRTTTTTNIKQENIVKDNPNPASVFTQERDFEFGALGLVPMSAEIQKLIAGERDSSEPLNVFRLAQGPVNDYNYCRQCLGETAAECIMANRIEQCHNAATMCETTYRVHRNGNVRYYSGCKSQAACSNNERQNFQGRLAWRHQCRSTRSLTSRFFRPIVCRFCHKMGTHHGTHLLFQSDATGTNDAGRILVGSPGLGYSTLDLDDILESPLANIQVASVQNVQLWYA